MTIMVATIFGGIFILALLIGGFVWTANRANKCLQSVLNLAQQMNAPSAQALQRTFSMEVSSLKSIEDALEKAVQRIYKQVGTLPVLERAAYSDPAETIMQRMNNIGQKLNEHAVLVAGMEQLFWNIIHLDNPQGVDQLMILLYADQIPTELRSAAQSIEYYFTSGHFQENLPTLLHNTASILGRIYIEHPKEIMNLISTAEKAITLIEENNKIGAVGTIAKHFVDSAHLKEYAHLVAAQPDISHAIHHLNNAETSAQQYAEHAMSSVHAHFPFVTLAVSSFREFKLIDNDKTTIDRALLNIGLDVAGSGGGGLLGLKGGALLGTMIMPGVGTVIGGIVGGVGGAMLGRTASNHVKTIPLKRAIQDFDAVYKKTEREVQILTIETSNYLSGALDTQRHSLQTHISSVSALTQGERQILVGTATDLARVTNREIQKAKTLLRQAGAIVNRRKPPIFTNPERIMQVKQLLPSLEYGFTLIGEASREQVSLYPYEGLKRLAVLPILSPYQARNIQQTMQKLQKLSKSSRKRFLSWSYQATQAYKRTTNSLKGTFRRKTEHYQGEVQKRSEEVKAAAGRVHRERERLGMD